MGKFNLPVATKTPAAAPAPATKKAAKAAPAKAPAPAKPAVKVAPKASGRAAFAGFPVDAKITVVSKEHDFVAGSIRCKAFEGILKAKTVAAARDASNGDPWHLRTAVAKRRVKVG